MSYKKNKKCLDCNVLVDARAQRCKSCAQKIRRNTVEELEKEKLAVEMYKNGRRITEILGKVERGKSWLWSKLKKNKVDTRKHHWYTFDSSVFDQENSNKYYLLGLFATDGMVGVNRSSKFICLRLNKKDEVLMNDIHKVFKTNKPMYLSKDNCMDITLFSDRLYDSLVSYGIVERKSWTLELKREIPKEFYADFLRGCFDGDGSISVQKNRVPGIYLCCGVSLKFIEQIINMYKYLGFDVTLTKSNREKPLYPIYTLSRPGRRGLFILKELYSHKGLFMPRKYEKFIEATRLTTDEIMMETAHTVSLRSTCLRAKVGCVITDENKNNILSMGYNGGVRGQENFCESSFPGECGCIHAECNALLKNKGPILYCTTMPCKSCSKMIVNAGVKAVYYGSEYRQSYAKSIFAKAKIPCKRISRENYSWKLDVVPK